MVKNLLKSGCFKYEHCEHIGITKTLFESVRFPTPLSRRQRLRRCVVGGSEHPTLDGGRDAVANRGIDERDSSRGR
jgi:hypothetical protein